MYGLIGKITAAAGKRDELIGILLEGVSGMPGCHSYARGRSVIAGFESQKITEPMGGQGLAP